MVFHVSSIDLFAKFFPITKEKFSPVNFVIMLLEKNRKSHKTARDRYENANVQLGLCNRPSRFFSQSM